MWLLLEKKMVVVQRFLKEPNDILDGLFNWKFLLQERFPVNVFCSLKT